MSNRIPKLRPLIVRIWIALRRNLWWPLRNRFRLASGRYLKGPDNWFPLNPGDQNPNGFFVDLDFCVECGVCGVVAPNFIGFVDGKYGSHVLRQPETDEELEMVRGALEVCCADVIYYGGDDPRARAIIDAVTPQNGKPKFTFLGSLARRIKKP